RRRIGARTAHLPEFPERIVERSDEVFGRSAPRHPDGLVSPTDVVQYSVLGRMIEVVLGNFEVGVVFFSRLGDHIEYVLEGNEVGVDSSDRKVQQVFAIDEFRSTDSVEIETDQMKIGRA